MLGVEGEVLQGVRQMGNLSLWSSAKRGKERCWDGSVRVDKAEDD